MSQNVKEKDKLYVLWTSGDKEVATKMVFMYTMNSKLRQWWEEVCLIIWGPSSKLLAADEELQDYIGKMKEIGVDLKACKACADLYGVSDQLEKMGIEVKYMGESLTEYLKEDCKILTF